MSITITVVDHKLNKCYSNKIIQIHLNLIKEIFSDEIIEPFIESDIFEIFVET